MGVLQERMMTYDDRSDMSYVKIEREGWREIPDELSEMSFVSI